MVDDEDGYDQEVLTIFAIDPGGSTGWSGLKVPVRLLSSLGVARTLVRCRHRHGTVRRSGGPKVLGGGAVYDKSDSPHVTDILDTARGLYQEFMGWEDEDGEWVEDPDAQFCFVMEGFDLREQSMDPGMLSPIRVGSILMDRLDQIGNTNRVFFQSASDAKNVVNDERLKRWGFYDRESGPHARDADRHAILMLRRFASSRDIRSRIFGYDPLGE